MQWNRTMNNNISIVLPSKNEGASLQSLLPDLKNEFPNAEIILVNDGSNDDTSSQCKKHGVIEIKHPYSKGNGAAIKSGTLAAKNDIIVFMDADGQHKPKEIHQLLEKMDEGYDLVVGARDNVSQASMGRLAANKAYNKLASFMVGHKVMDLTSGFRAVKKNKFKEFLHLLPNGFSYPTTSTMAFFRAGYSVAYSPITTDKRIGNSHLQLGKDGVRFLIIIFKVGILYSPLKIFAPISAGLFALGIARYTYTFLNYQTFTNMTALLFSTSLLVFLMGLVSEQITILIYQLKHDDKHDRDTP